MARQRTILLAIALISLATLWGCRLPRLCLYSQPATDITSSPPSHHTVDLSSPTAPFIGWPLARVCSETTWVPGLVFICDNNSGGIGNIRNFILTCLRYAIEAGAIGLVMPKIRTRSADSLSDLMSGDYKEFEYFFQEAHFRSALAASCPRMEIYNQTWDIPHTREPFQPERITPRDYGSRGGCDQRDLNRHGDLFGERFRRWLGETAAERGWPDTSKEHPRVIRLNWGVQWDWPAYRDGPEFVATYGGLLRFREDLLELGRAVEAAMRAFAAKGSGEGVDGSSDSDPAKFAGFHLRTENDALKGWPNFENQTMAYLHEASGRSFKAGYLATGNATEAAKFVSQAHSQHEIQVTTKQDLLAGRPEALEALQGLSWDQQAVVDFLVLLGSDYFMGVSPSSFSMNVALKRHLRMEGLHTRPWKVGREGDGRSWLVGRYEKYWEDWLFMYDSLWP